MGACGKQDMTACKRRFYLYKLCFIADKGKGKVIGGGDGICPQEAVFFAAAGYAAAASHSCTIACMLIESVIRSERYDEYDSSSGLNAVFDGGRQITVRAQASDVMIGHWWLQILFTCSLSVKA